MKIPRKKVLASLDAYKEGVDYQCGDLLFDAANVAEGDMTLKGLAETFHVRQALTCRDVVEPFYFNYRNVRGGVDLEWVCCSARTVVLALMTRPLTQRHVAMAMFQAIVASPWLLRRLCCPCAWVVDKRSANQSLLAHKTK